MERSAVEAFVADYERLWRTPGTALLRTLFTEDATYLPSPWAKSVDGLEAIARSWDAERDGPDEQFSLTSEVVAVDGTRAVVRVQVDYADSRPWRDLWVLGFAEDGRCSSFEEWPFSPDQPDGHE
jgi:ketosteroid isomerase-like protein